MIRMSFAVWRISKTLGVRSTSLAEHKQVDVEGVEIDEGIADLIVACWDRGIETVLSCENNSGRIWIEFFEESDLVEFTRIAAGEFSDDVESLYNRVLPEFEPVDWEAFRENRAWMYGINPEMGVEPHFYPWVRFPISDYAEVLRRFQ